MLSLAAISLAAVAHVAAQATIYSSCVTPNTVALTFDDGPWIYETEVSQALANAGIKGTFFVNGDNYECIYDDAMIDAVRSTFAAGHEFGSHTWQHMDLTTLSSDDLNNQMFLTEQALQRVLGVQPALMRPPYGNINDLVQQVAGQRNQSLILWDFDDGDSTGSTVQQSEDDYTNLIQQHPNNVLALNHETYQTSAEQVIPFAINALQQAGYQFATVSECLGIEPYQFTMAQGTKDDTWTC